VLFDGWSATGALSGFSTGAMSGFSTGGEGRSSRTRGATAGPDAAGRTELATGWDALAGTIGLVLAPDRHTAERGPTSRLSANAAANPMVNPRTFCQRGSGASRRSLSRLTGTSSITDCLLSITNVPEGLLRIVD
jgi:hypothetical protein